MTITSDMLLLFRTSAAEQAATPWWRPNRPVSVLDFCIWMQANGYAGPVGQCGATWTTGSGVPIAPGVTVDDLYLNTLTGDVYRWSSSAWAIVANIVGAVGAQGSQGNVGATGAAGASITGPTGPTGPSGVVGYASDGSTITGFKVWSGTTTTNSSGVATINPTVDGTPSAAPIFATINAVNAMAFNNTATATSAPQTAGKLVAADRKSVTINVVQGIASLAALLSPTQVFVGAGISVHVTVFGS